MKELITKTGIQSKNKIFVNRTLNFGHIKLIGFDMDHTLAPYHQNFESLAFQETLKKFIADGYPEELSSLTFKKDYAIRGLIVDRERGNILRVDGHKYVKDAYHGHTRLTKDERYSLYNKHSIRAQDFLSVDTYFALSEVQLFIEIVDYMNKNPGKIEKSYAQVYSDLRKFIDLSHRDGTIKTKVLSNPEKYIHRDRYLATTLVRLLDAGKKLFLLTNSHYSYTNVVMNYLLADGHDEFPDWKDYWQYIIVGGGKPGFFTGSQPFFEVIEKSGLLKIHSGDLDPSKVYYGGNAKKFEQLTGYNGDEILYVGDHIYGDIIQSKGLFNWRTMLVVEELNLEIPKHDEVRKFTKEINEKLDDREKLDEELQKIRSILAANKRQAHKASLKNDEKKVQSLDSASLKLTEKLNNKKDQLKQLEEYIKDLIDERDSKFHPLWGELMKVGLKRSRFANQVSNYACIYSSQVSNLRFYSPYKKFISFHERLPHEE